MKLKIFIKELFDRNECQEVDAHMLNQLLDGMKFIYSETFQHPTIDGIVLYLKHRYKGIFVVLIVHDYLALGSNPFLQASKIY